MRTTLIGSVAAFLLAACATSRESAPSPVEVHSTGVPGQAAAITSREMTAKVLAVDTASRRLTLQGEDGHTQTVEVPSEVKRLDEIAVGDAVRLEVQEGILFEYRAPSSASVPTSSVVAAGRAGPSEPPGGAAAASVQSTVTVTAIDLKSRVVELTDADGLKFHVKAGPNLAIEKLKTGDRLLATYVATIAIAVEKD